MKFNVFVRRLSPFRETERHRYARRLENGYLSRALKSPRTQETSVLRYRKRPADVRVNFSPEFHVTANTVKAVVRGSMNTNGNDHSENNVMANAGNAAILTLN